MANELNWLRSKAAHKQTDSLVITPEQAASAECEPGTYKVEFFAFSGTVPYRMIKALRGSKLINTETENEVLHLGNGYRSGDCQCRYYRTVHERVAA